MTDKPTDDKLSTRLLRAEEICAPPPYDNPIAGNFILLLIKHAKGSPDAENFGDLLLKELEAM
jgi:hypothetical protein